MPGPGLFVNWALGGIAHAVHCGSSPAAGQIVASIVPSTWLMQPAVSCVVCNELLAQPMCYLSTYRCLTRNMPALAAQCLGNLAGGKTRRIQPSSAPKAAARTHRGATGMHPNIMFSSDAWASVLGWHMQLHADVWPGMMHMCCTVNPSEQESGPHGKLREMAKGN